MEKINLNGNDFKFKINYFCIENNRRKENSGE